MFIAVFTWRKDFQILVPRSISLKINVSLSETRVSEEEFWNTLRSSGEINHEGYVVVTEAK